MQKKSGPIDERALKEGRGGKLLLFGIFLLLAGCSGGESGPPPMGIASGKLIVPPDNTVEVEPNDALAQAQAVLETTSVSGSASETDPGFTTHDTAGTQVKVEDLYRLSATGPVRIILSIAAKELEKNDLDLFLLDSSGKTLKDSQGLVSTEFIETPGGGDFIVGVRAFRGASAYVLDFSSLGNLRKEGSEAFPPGAEVVLGEILVKRKEGSGAHRKADLFAAHYGLMHKESFPEGVDLLRLSPPSLSHQKGAFLLPEKSSLPEGDENAVKAQMWEMIQRLRSDPEVEYAEPNFIRHPSAVPNDERFPLQWDDLLINLPQAWEVTQGSDNVIVAVIDSGVLFNHPDLAPRLMPGYDFITDPANAGDPDDGIDSDATDVGDDPKGISSSFHGTHVAGIIGAAANNSIGVSGITWQTRIMPVRVCGKVGCLDSDIAQAILYAAGLKNNSGTLPAQRANVINLSLGGAGFSQTQQNAIRAARNAGVMIVAAAGNENVGTFTSPASLEGVISVAAVDINSKKAPYSNYGPHIDAAAPGGNAAADLNGDGFPDGILSSWGDDKGQFGYRYMQGTSMAAPHVSGILALMLAVNPLLTPGDIDQLLAGTHPATTIRITRDLGSVGRDDLYGHGLIDASQAVIAAKAIPGGVGGSAPAGSILGVSNLSLDFSNFIDSLPIDLTNAGIGTINVTGVTSSASWLTVTPSSGTAPLTINAAVDRSGLIEGDYTAAIQIASDAGQNPTATTQVKIRVGGNTLGNVGTVFVLVIDAQSLKTVQETEASVAEGYSFTTPKIPAGTYFIVAGTDRNNDHFICDPEDACGFYPERISITSDREIPNINFIVEALVSPQSTASVAGQLKGKTFRRLD